MARSRFLTLAATATLLGAAACNLDNSNGPNAFLSDLAFSSAPAGLDLVSSSYASSSDNGMPWGGPGRGPGGGPGMGGFMGGGLGDAFIGNAAPGRGAHGGPFGIRIDDSCVYAAGTGDLTCGPTVKNGLTVTTIYTIKNAAGTAQSAIDSVTTNSVRVRTAVTGTATRSRDGSVTATVNNSGDRTVTGLAAGSTQRTVNGASQGSETATGTNRDGKTFSQIEGSFGGQVRISQPLSLGGGVALAPLAMGAAPSGVSAQAQTPAPAAYSSTSTVGVLLDNPATKAVLLAIIPDVVNNPQIDQGRGMQLRELAQYVPTLTPEMFAKIDAELAKLPKS